jgi:hypothetical protein
VTSRYYLGYDEERKKQKEEMEPMKNSGGLFSEENVDKERKKEKSRHNQEE